MTDQKEPTQIVEWGPDGQHATLSINLNQAREVIILQLSEIPPNDHRRWELEMKLAIVEQHIRS